MTKPRTKARVYVKKSWALSTDNSELFGADPNSADVIGIPVTNWQMSYPFVEITFQPPKTSWLVNAVIPAENVVLIIEPKSPAALRTLGFTGGDS